jgi:hypothetical protein
VGGGLEHPSRVLERGQRVSRGLFLCLAAR